MSESMTVHIIARIRSDFPTKFGIPRQSGLADAPARIVFEPEYRNADALRGIGLETVYAPLEVAAQTGLSVILPRVFSDNEQPEIEMQLGEAMSRGAMYKAQEKDAVARREEHCNLFKMEVK